MSKLETGRAARRIADTLLEAGGKSTFVPVLGATLWQAASELQKLAAIAESSQDVHPMGILTLREYAEKNGITNKEFVPFHLGACCALDHQILSAGMQPVTPVQQARAEAERDNWLIETLQEARDSIESWAAYASEHFQKRHKLEEELAQFDAAIAKAKGQQPTSVSAAVSEEVNQVDFDPADHVKTIEPVGTLGTMAVAKMGTLLSGKYPTMQLAHLQPSEQPHQPTDISEEERLAYAALDADLEDAERFRFAAIYGWPEKLPKVNLTDEYPTWGYGTGPRYPTAKAAIDAGRIAVRDRK